MALLENIRIALASLEANRLRAFLAMLGIIIGVAAVVSMVSLGQGVSQYINRQFADLGANRLNVYTVAPTGGLRTKITPLTTRTVEALRNPSVAPSVRQIALEYSAQARLIGPKTLNLSVTGVSPNYAEVSNWEVQLGGRFIQEEDIEGRNRVAILGTSMVSRIFGSESFNPVGMQISLNGSLFTIIGVMERRAGVLFFDPNAVILVPLSTAQTRLENALAPDGGYRVTRLIVEVVSKEKNAAAIREIYSYLMQAHAIPAPGNEDFAIESEGQILASLTQISSSLTLFLAAVGGISLLVGGIGIMNIMLVSVTERTREIGLRKAVGARDQDILSQFMVESLLISLLGGTIGVLLGNLILTIATLLISNLELRLDPNAVLLATGISSAVGLFFGYYPAQRAAQLAPTEALRYE